MSKQSDILAEAIRRRNNDSIANVIGRENYNYDVELLIPVDGDIAPSKRNVGSPEPKSVLPPPPLPKLQPLAIVEPPPPTSPPVVVRPVLPAVKPEPKEPIKAEPEPKVYVSNGLVLQTSPWGLVLAKWLTQICTPHKYYTILYDTYVELRSAKDYVPSFRITKDPNSGKYRDTTIIEMFERGKLTYEKAYMLASRKGFDASILFINAAFSLKFPWDYEKRAAKQVQPAQGLSDLTLLEKSNIARGSESPKFETAGQAVLRAAVDSISPVFEGLVKPKMIVQPAEPLPAEFVLPQPKKIPAKTNTVPVIHYEKEEQPAILGPDGWVDSTHEHIKEVPKGKEPTATDASDTTMTLHGILVSIGKDKSAFNDLVARCQTLLEDKEHLLNCLREEYNLRRIAENELVLLRAEAMKFSTEFFNLDRQQ
jgi:hypothetical protein